MKKITKISIIVLFVLSGVCMNNIAQVTSTLTNNVITNNTGSFKALQVISEPGNALDFDGINDYVSTSDNDGGLSEFTIETWVKWNPDTNSDVQFICGKKFEQMEIHTGATANNIRFIPTTGVYLDAVNVLKVGVWTHIAVVYNPSVSLAKMYVNGKEVALVNNGSNPISTTIKNTSNTFYIGKRGDSSYYFKGSIDEMKIWNKVRTPEEIYSDMINSTNPQTAGLIGYYNFNEGTANGNNTATTLPDLSPNAYNGTLNGFALSGTASNWVESYAMVIPTATAATDTTANGFTANWTVPQVGVVDNYLLYVATDEAFTNQISGYNPKTIASGNSEIVTGLSPKTTYYYKIVADKSTLADQGASSNIISVQTLAKEATVTTQAVTNVSTIIATANGTITDLGVPQSTAYGFCWNTTGNPTINDSKINKGAASTTGAFSSFIFGLSNNTTYYLRAYATNEAGTSYGEEVSFSTFTLTLEVSESGVEIGKEEGSNTSVNVSSNTYWGASSDQNWLSVSIASPEHIIGMTKTVQEPNPYPYSGNQTLLLTATANTDNSTRTANVTLAANGVQSKTITVTQRGGITTGFDIQRNEIMIYPNPTADGFIINAGEKATTISIYDLSGNLILSKPVQGHDYVNVSDLSKGIYIVKLNLETYKLIKK